MKAILLATLLLLGCNTVRNCNANLNDLTCRSLGYLTKKYDITSQGTGIAKPDKVQYITYGFRVEKKMSVPEIRELLVNISQRVIKDINSNSELKECFIKYPFEMDSIMITLIIYDNGKLVKYPDASFVSLGINQIKYEQFSYDNYERKTIHSESYQEAYDIVVKEGKLQE